MPRLLAGGPGLGVSPEVNGRAVLAVAGSGRLSLLDAESREELAAAHLSGEATDVGFVMTAGALRAVSFARHEATTLARAFTVPGLEPAGQLELTGLVRPTAFVADRILVCDDAGDHPRMVTVAPRLFTVDPIALREPVHAAVGTENAKLLVMARDQVESWDPMLRRALSRINLPVTKVRQVGFAARWKFLWVASAAGIEVFRFSDGRLQVRIDLGQRFVAADGHPDSARLVVATRSGEQPIELEEIDLVREERRKLAVTELGGGAASFCLVEGATPAVVLADSDARVEFHPLEAQASGASALPPKRPRSATPPVAVRAGDVAQPLSDAFGGWRARLGGSDKDERRATAAARAEPRSPSATLVPDEVSEPELTDAKSSGEIARRAEAGGAAGSIESAADFLSAPAPAENWRATLVAWGAQVLARDEPAAAPPALILADEGSAFATLATELSLGPHARAVLAMLYAARLVGRVQGLPIATVARVDGPDWIEALGTGELAAAELVRIRRGRLKLRGAAAAFLDGRALPGE
ncbi:MAG TPA: hypothetical protein VII38_18440 [Polyangia bacterium]